MFPIMIGLLFIGLLLLGTVIFCLVRDSYYIEKLEKENNRLADKFLKIHELSVYNIFESYHESKNKEIWLRHQMQEIRNIAFEALVKKD